MAEVYSERFKIDRLSRLPAETLTAIFDFADDPRYLHLEALSKTLLPHFRRKLYRRIRLRSFPSLVKLLDTLYSDNNLIYLILHVDTSDFDGEGSEEIRETLSRFLNLLPPQLCSYSTQLPVPLSVLLSVLLAKHLSTITSISYFSPKLVTSDFDTLKQLPKLERLEISFNFEEDGRGRVFSETTDITRLSLKNVGGDPWTVEASHFIDCFTKLTHLTLWDSGDAEYSETLEHLTRAPTTLKSLSLKSSFIYGNYECYCDRQLPRFKNLQHLEVDDVIASDAFDNYVQELPHLRSLRLGPSAHVCGPTAADLVPLIRGPHRLASLDTLILDCVDDRFGNQTVSAADLFQGKVQRWEEPDFEQAGWEVPEVIKLWTAGKAHRVEVMGSTLQAVRLWRAAKLEEANRMILAIYQTRSFDEYNFHFECEGINPRLPILDVANLDPNNLILVKINLPEEGWFRLTLTRKVSWKENLRDWIVKGLLKLVGLDVGRWK